jgi:hypothetical protein
MMILIVICSLLLTSLVVNTIFTILMYNKLMRLLVINGAYQSEEYRKAVAIPKNKKPNLPFKRETVRGRNIEKSNDLVDIADLPWEDGYKALEDM